MRFLADAGLSPLTVDFLIQLGHEATHVRTLGMQRAPDAEIILRAHADSSIVLTFDLDFGDVLALGVLDKPSVIIFRLVDCRSDGRIDIERILKLCARKGPSRSGTARRSSSKTPETPRSSFTSRNRPNVSG